MRTEVLFGRVLALVIQSTCYGQRHKVFRVDFKSPRYPQNKILAVQQGEMTK